MSHHCDHIVIHCMDYRLQEQIVLNLRLKGMFGDCDIISWPGAIKDFISPKKPEYREHMFEPIHISYERHEARMLTLMQHMDCGAYGGKTSFEDENQEFERHASDMRQVADLIREQFPDMEIMMKIITMDGDRVKDFKEVK